MGPPQIGLPGPHITRDMRPRGPHYTSDMGPWGPHITSDMGTFWWFGAPLHSHEKLSTRQQCASQTSSIRFWKYIFCFNMPMCYLFFSPCACSVYVCLWMQDLSCRSLNLFAFDLGPQGPQIMHYWYGAGGMYLPKHQKTGNSREH